MENLQLLGLLIQASGALLVGLLCLMLNRVVRSAALRSWVYGWSSLGIALASLLIDELLPETAPVALPCFLFGEYLFGYWMIRGCAQFAGRESTKHPRGAAVLLVAACAFLLPVIVGTEFRRIFMIQSALLALMFLAAFIALKPIRRPKTRASGLLFIRSALLLLTLTFALYPPIFAANVFFNHPLPMQFLSISSAAHLLFEFLLGFGGAVMILEEHNRDLFGRNSVLSDAVEKYRGEAERDALTNAYNRRALIGRLERILSDAASASRRVTLLYLDVDNFKDVNDLHGHAFGDQLLIAVARRLHECVTSEDLVVRMGGDEFIVIAVSVQTPQAVEALAKRIARELDDPLSIDGRSISARSSIGISTYPDDGSSAGMLLQQADVALYQAKACGKNGFRRFDASMKQRDRERAILTTALNEAIGTDQLYVDYQPIIDLQTSRIVSLEALLRWRHPERGLISPDIFIGLAEQGGFIHLIGDAVVRTVCRQLQQWRRCFVPLVPIAVNVSSREFEQGGLAQAFGATIAEFDIDPRLIRIEITETELMRNVAEHSKTLHILRNSGVMVCIDDFGTGYSSLSYLKNIPIDCLKIDRSFIVQMTSDDRDAAIVQGIVGIANSMDITVVAEGVESEEQAQCLKALGCSHAQGYLFHRPMSADHCRNLLEAAAPAPARSQQQLPATASAC